MSPKRNESQPQSATGTVPDRVGQDLFAPTPAEQRTARIMGAWFLGTFIAVPAFFFYDPILNHADYVVGSGADIGVAVGALLEILLAIAGIATAVVIFPIVKRVNEIVALRQDYADAPSNSGALTDVAGGLLAVHDQIALLGPQLCAGLGNGILLGYLMWQSRLLPRPLVMIGLIGGPLALLAGIGVLLGAWGIRSRLPVALTAPEAIWEFSLSVWLLAKGFRPSPILTGPPVTPSKTS